MDIDEESFLLFYINEPSIIIGKNQNTIEEINTDFVEANGIHIVRRLSGGGAVYHDLGNLNFSFITKDDGESVSVILRNSLNLLLMHSQKWVLKLNYRTQ